MCQLGCTSCHVEVQGVPSASRVVLCNVPRHQVEEFKKHDVINRLQCHHHSSASTVTTSSTDSRNDLPGMQLPTRHRLGSNLDLFSVANELANRFAIRGFRAVTAFNYCCLHIQLFIKHWRVLIKLSCVTDAVTNTSILYNFVPHCWWIPPPPPRLII